MKRNNIIKSLLMGSAAAICLACTVPSADEHPNHSPYTKDEGDTGDVEIGSVLFSVNGYQKINLSIRSMEVKSNGGEAITFSGTESDTISELCDSPVSLAVSDSTAFVVRMAAGTYEKGLTFSLIDDFGRIFSYCCDTEVEIEEDKVTALVEKPVPLTIYYGKSNCYRTAAAGNVEIDITPYYTFSYPYVYEDLKAADKDGNSAGVATAAEIVWQYAASGLSGDVVGTPSITGTTLKVPATGTLGNALVSIKNDAGNIMWSYHVWVSDAKDIPHDTEKYGQFDLLDRNLGATSAAAADENAYGLFYQWGRKDPFPRPFGISGTVDYTLVEHPGTSASTGTIGYAIQHPTVRLNSTGTKATGDWLYAAHDQALWGNTTSDKTANDKGIKTVYDPCPEGYRVPCLNALDGYTKEDDDYAVKGGHTFKTGVGDNTIFYPCGGFVVEKAAQIQDCGTRYFIWTNVPGGNGAFDYVTAANGSISTGGHNRAIGSALRCIKIVGK